MITLKPTGGLCNRMRAINAAEALAAQSNHSLEVIWECNPLLNCKYHELFKPVPGFTVKNTKPDIRYNTSHHSGYGFLRRNVHRLLNGLMFSKTYFETPPGFDVPGAAQLLAEVKNKKKIYISATLPFYPGGRYESFQPVDNLQEIINQSAAAFNGQVTGLHLRRTDHVHSISESPDELFIQVVEQELAANPNARFFLATDDPETEQRFIQRFGNAIIVHPKTFGRDSAQGIKDAVVDLYLLSRTQKLYASFQSSFSETAGIIGNIPLEVLKRK